MPDLYIIAGPNGAGKTTAASTILPEMLHCREFVNADNIAAGLSPFNPEGAAFEAGRIMLQRIRFLLSTKEDFAFETTLAAKSYISLIKEAQAGGYSVTVAFFWLPSFTMAIERVKQRVLEGGHHIPADVIIRRYQRGVYNLFELFMPICDTWILIDNSEITPKLIANGDKGGSVEVINQQVWQQVIKQIQNK
ncbi:zeta toxin family protein [Runella salmonicolor]|uniref:Zeta toxin family protein n=1 Tax=Runella salmonicolor TaxID=2950278 RepID=A0ABT1FGF1_9BACT|nr:zeta toxin family protein [Runella salmonicolor]MCP1380828.1 zeta toxin family protein [Runella salmonicolor]